MFRAFYASYAHENGLFKLAFSALLLAPLALFLGIAPIDAVIYWIGLLFIIWSFLEKNFSWLKEPWVKVFLVLWLYMMIRGFFTINPLLSVVQSAIFIRFALLTLALQYWLLKKASARDALTISLLITLVFAAADGLLQLFTGDDWLGHHIPVNFSQPWRLSAISGKLAIGAKFSMITLPAIAYSITCFYKAKKEVIAWGSLLLAFVFIVFVPLSGERNATLMLLLGLGLMFLFYRSFRLPLFIMISLAALIMTSLSYFSEGFKNRASATREVIVKIMQVDSSISKSAEVNPYASLLKTDWNIFIENPIFGVGRKQYNLYCKQAPDSIATTKKDINMCITNAQNIYFEWLDETGLIGFSLFFSMIALWFRQFYLQRKLLLGDAIVFAAFLQVAIRLWPLASTSSFFFSWCGGPFWLMAGWVFAYLSQNKVQSI